MTGFGGAGLSIQGVHTFEQTDVRQTGQAGQVFVRCSNVLSLHACRSKYISGAQNCAVTRRLSLQMQLRYTKMHSGSTPVSPNDCFTCSNVLSLDTCRSKRIATPEIHLPRFVTFLFVDLHPFGTLLFGPERPEVFVLDAILEAGKRKKYLFCRARNLVTAGGPSPPHPHPLRASLKHFDAITSSFTEGNEISPRWGQWRRLEES